MPRRPRAVFLDRDGTINREVDLLRRLGQLRLLPGAAEGIRALNRMGYRVIVVTNQPVVARGWMTESRLRSIHRALEARLRRRGARLDAVFYCPHHPDADLLEYRIRCRCRKPATGLIRRAVRELGVATQGSFMVGDSTRDILAGRRAGLETILLATGYAGKDGKYPIRPDHTASDLVSAARLIGRLRKRR